MPKYGKKSQGKTDFPSLGHVRVGSHDHWLGGWIILIIKPRPYAHPVARFNCQKGREECRCKIFFFFCPSYWVKFYKSNTQGAHRLSVQEDLFIRDLWLFQTFFFIFLSYTKPPHLTVDLKRYSLNLKVRVELMLPAAFTFNSPLLIFLFVYY